MSFFNEDAKVSHAGQNTSAPSAKLADHLAAGQTVGPANSSKRVTRMDLLVEGARFRQQALNVAYNRLSEIAIRSNVSWDIPPMAERQEPIGPYEELAYVLDSIAQLTLCIEQVTMSLEEIV